MSWKRHALDVAEVIDAYRLWPRAMVVVLFWLAVEVGLWFMALENPTAPQASLVDVVIAGVFGVFASYAATGRKWDREK